MLKRIFSKYGYVPKLKYAHLVYKQNCVRSAYSEQVVSGPYQSCTRNHTLTLVLALGWRRHLSPSDRSPVASMRQGNPVCLGVYQPWCQQLQPGHNRVESLGGHG